MHTNILNTRQIEVLAILKGMTFIADFYLVGGTALALQYGHRESVDFDFVTKDTFSPEKIYKRLGEKGKIKLEQEDKDSLTVVLEGVSCSFLLYEYPVLNEFLLFEDRIKLAGIADIAAMKVAAVAGRGIKRDFVDLYFICQKDTSLPEVIDYYQRKFEVFKQDLHHIYKSLIYFEDAEEDAMPRLYQDADWEQIKNYFIKEVSKLILT